MNSYFLDSFILLTAQAIVIAHILTPLFFALKGINASTAGILIFINPIVNFLLAIFYYKEPISSLQYIAYGIIFLAIIVFNSGYLFGNNKKKEIETVVTLVTVLQLLSMSCTNTSVQSMKMKLLIYK